MDSKTFGLILIVVAAAVAVTGVFLINNIPSAAEATKREMDSRPDAMFEMVDDGLGYEVFRHKKTGCHYIGTGSSYGAYTAMVTPTGKPFCD